MAWLAALLYRSLNLRKRPHEGSLASNVIELVLGEKWNKRGIWLVSFMDYDLGYIDLEEKTLRPLNNPFGPKL